ncbi:unnamed protein product [marine sediment metagenome]|uniref:Uncharacterized protein n=1 Tax=marine sediment metagenome TaxID=412755 RepID=X1KMV0_9ZZZZ
MENVSPATRRASHYNLRLSLAAHDASPFLLVRDKLDLLCLRVHYEHARWNDGCVGETLRCRHN